MAQRREQAGPRPGAGRARDRGVLPHCPGLSNREIAAELLVSEATVRTHVAQVLARLGLRDRAQIAVFAYEHGIVRPGSTHVAPFGQATSLQGHSSAKRIREHS